MDINSVVTQNKEFNAQVISAGEHWGAQVTAQGFYKTVQRPTTVPISW